MEQEPAYQINARGHSSILADFSPIKQQEYEEGDAGEKRSNTVGTRARPQAHDMQRGQIQSILQDLEHELDSISINHEARLVREGEFSPSNSMAERQMGSAEVEQSLSSSTSSSSGKSDYFDYRQGSFEVDGQQVDEVRAGEAQDALFEPEVDLTGYRMMISSEQLGEHVENEELQPDRGQREVQDYAQYAVPSRQQNAHDNGGAVKVAASEEEGGTAHFKERPIEERTFLPNNLKPQDILSLVLQKDEAHFSEQKEPVSYNNAIANRTTDIFSNKNFEQYAKHLSIFESPTGHAASHPAASPLTARLNNVKSRIEAISAVPQSAPFYSAVQLNGTKKSFPGKEEEARQSVDDGDEIEIEEHVIGQVMQSSTMQESDIQLQEEQILTDGTSENYAAKALAESQAVTAQYTERPPQKKCAVHDAEQWEECEGPDSDESYIPIINQFVFKQEKIIQKNVESTRQTASQTAELLLENDNVRVSGNAAAAASPFEQLLEFRTNKRQRAQEEHVDLDKYSQEARQYQPEIDTLKSIEPDFKESLMIRDLAASVVSFRRQQQTINSLRQTYLLEKEENSEDYEDRMLVSLNRLKSKVRLNTSHCITAKERAERIKQLMFD